MLPKHHRIRTSLHELLQQLRLSGLSLIDVPLDGELVDLRRQPPQSDVAVPLLYARHLLPRPRGCGLSILLHELNLRLRGGMPLRRSRRLVLLPTRVVSHEAPVVDLDHARRELAEEEAVVTHHNGSTFECFEGVLEELARGDVEMVGGLVEHEEGGGLHEEGGERDPSLLATAEGPNGLAFGDSIETQALKHGLDAPCLVDVFGRAAQVQGVLHRVVFVVEGLGQALREVGHACVRELHGPGHGRALAEIVHERLDHRALPAAVTADDGNLLPGEHLEGHAVEDRPPRISHAQVLHVEQGCRHDHALCLSAAAAALLRGRGFVVLGGGVGVFEELGRLGEAEVSELGDLGFRHRIVLHPLPGLPLLCSLLQNVAAFKLLDLLLETPKLFLVLLVSLPLPDEDSVARLQELDVVASIHSSSALVDLYDLLADAVQEVTVVRNDNHGHLLRLQESLHELNSLQVDVVRGLIQEDEVRPAQDDLAQRHPHLPSARELAERRVAAAAHAERRQERLGGLEVALRNLALPQQGVQLVLEGAIGRAPLDIRIDGRYRPVIEVRD
mmetsp:Transcript_116512/g.290946  ORF Transcript_116512/g.290946 Transcript_116512/m.290946 type:complete len:559 (-) Transcript_116512:445-2121(-)